MHWGLQSRGRVLRGILPLLAMVWATATWHDCYLEGLRGQRAAADVVEHCAHHPLPEVGTESAPDVRAPDHAPSCNEAAYVGPDLRSAPPELLTLRSFASIPLPAAAFDRPVGLPTSRIAGIPPDKPLQQRPARLLI